MCLKKLWNATIFPDMIAAKKERKAQQRAYDEEERKLREQLQHDARLEALAQAKDVLKEKMIQEEVKNITEGKQNKFSKVLKNIGNDLANSGFKMPDNNKMRDVWGANNKQPGSNTAQQTSSSTLPSQEKISSMMGGGVNRYTNNISKNANNYSKEKQERFEADRIKHLIHGKENFNYGKEPVNINRKKVKKLSSSKNQKIELIIKQK